MMVNSHEKTVVFMLTANSPSTHVTPSKGSRTILPFTALLNKEKDILVVIIVCRLLELCSQVLLSLVELLLSHKLTLLDRKF